MIAPIAHLNSRSNGVEVPVLRSLILFCLFFSMRHRLIGTQYWRKVKRGDVGEFVG